MMVLVVGFAAATSPTPALGAFALPHGLGVADAGPVVLPLPAESPGGQVARRYEKRWTKAHRWEVIGLAAAGGGAVLELAGWAELAAGNDGCVDCFDDDADVFGLMGVTYGVMFLYAGAGTVFAADLVARRGFAEPAPVTGYLVSGGGVLMTLIGIGGLAGRGIDDPLAQGLTLAGPILVGAGGAVQLVVDEGAAAKGFRVAVVPTGNGVALAGTF